MKAVLNTWDGEELQATTKALLKTIGSQDRPVESERLYWLMLLVEEMVDAQAEAKAEARKTA